MRCHCKGWRTLGVIGLLLAASPSAGQVVEVPTFPVGAAVFSEHLQDVDVAAALDGSFVVIWGDYSLHSLNGNNNHATTRRFSAQGVPLSPPVMADTSAHVFSPHISADGRGGYVAAWQWIGASDYLFFGQYLDALGAPTGSDFEVGLNLAGWPITSGTVLGRPSGPTFVWQENGFWARSLDQGKDRVGGDMRVGSGGYTNAIAPLPDGGFITLWAGGFDESGSMGRIFGPNGQPRTDAFEVGQTFGGHHAAADPFGGIAISGGRWDAAANKSDVWVRRFADDGVPIGEGFLVHTGLPNSYVDTDLAFDAVGNLYVVWSEYSEFNTQPVRARAFDTDSNPLGPEIAITNKLGVEPRTVRLQNGSFVNVWYWGGQAWGSIVRLCTAAMATCGDGITVPACEQCDQGGANSDTLADACRTTCVKPRCSDGVIDTGEQCDDGNRTNCDGCSAQCQVEPGVSCGDGVRNGACGEECDSGAANNDAAPDACRTNCRLARCGDGTQDSGEECDDGNTQSCDGCSFDCKVEAPGACDACLVFAFASPGGLCTPPTYPGLSTAQRARFESGGAEFLEIETPASGLGPVFNGARCGECHNQPTNGGSSARFVTRIGATTIGANGYPTFDPLVAHGGPLIQSQGITTASCSVPGEVVPPEAVFVGQRNTPALYGLGLLEAVPDVTLRLFADVIDRNGDGISGRFNVAPNGIIGRFGWKAQISSLHDFAATAYLDEMGITNPFATQEHAPQGGPLVCDNEPDPEDDGGDVAGLTNFMELLAPVPAPPKLTREAKKGRSLFRKLKCHLCHTDKYRTPSNFPNRVLRNQRVRAYTDLMLHDMGPGLDDGIVQQSASGSEFRTPPLWGVRYSAPYLHDGRAPTLWEAVAAHGGEAQKARDRFMGLTPTQQAALVAYLNAL